MKPAIFNDVDVSKPFHKNEIENIINLIRTQKLVIFKNQHLTPDQFINFNKQFGTLWGNIVFEKGKNHAKLDNYENITRISNINGALSYHKIPWHHDVLHGPLMTPSSMLYAINIPKDCTAKTHWADNEDGLKNLTNEEIRYLKTTQFNHKSNWKSKWGTGRWTNGIIQNPLTGKDSFALDQAFTVNVDNIDEWITKIIKDCVYSHTWKTGDLIFYDNWGTMHKRDAFKTTSERLLYRTTLDLFDKFLLYK